MCSTVRRGPRWAGLYVVVAGLLAAVPFVEALVPAGPWREAVPYALSGAVFAVMAIWVRRHRVALSALDWCECARGEIRVRVVTAAVPARIGTAHPPDAIPEEEQIAASVQ